jgi:hypothetical protein
MGVAIDRRVQDRRVPRRAFRRFRGARRTPRAGARAGAHVARTQPASLSTAIQNGARTFEEAGGPRAYFGWPADATAEEGRATIETLGTILADAVREALAKKGIA